MSITANDIVHLGLLATPVSIFWLLGMQNTVNFLDGADGLAAGVVFIVAVTLMLAAAGLGQIDVVQLGNRSRITVRPALPQDADLQRELTRRVRNRRLSREVRMDQQREENTSWPPGNPIRLSIPHPAWP